MNGITDTRKPEYDTAEGDDTTLKYLDSPSSTLVSFNTVKQLRSF